MFESFKPILYPKEVLSIKWLNFKWGERFRPLASGQSTSTLI